ncbi:UNVERIFIED_CONTAM: hypothetical protein Scaly_2960700 [Sesamum calycinum]|uniref:Uncharacterized protein n=1 Tax=Sesamum calycinum TaxID=2727403 RepID=A0AAW2KPJ8_9LAMI
MTSHGEERVQDTLRLSRRPFYRTSKLPLFLQRRVPVQIWVMRRRVWFSMLSGQLISLLINQDGSSDDVHVAEQLLWNGCTQSQLGVVAKLVDIKVNGHIYERIYDRIFQWVDRIFPHDHTLPLDYYNMKKLIKDLGLAMEKIHACKNGCMLYWKDDIDLEYCKFYGKTKYKLTRERTSNRKKIPYVIFRYLSLTPHLQRLHASEATTNQMTWHANH